MFQVITSFLCLLVDLVVSAMKYVNYLNVEYFYDQLINNFQLKVYIRHMGQNIYNIYYRVREGGEYRIVVKYGSDHIPGSPFHLRI